MSKTSLPTYREQYDKIIEAYFRDEIEPYDGNFCFCGTLAGGCVYWSRHDIEPSDFRDFETYKYTTLQFARMEDALLLTIRKETVGYSLDGEHFKQLYALSYFGERETIKRHSNYETALFNGMCAALDVLRQIHIERGENVDEVPVFTKRTKQQLINQ